MKDRYFAITQWACGSDKLSPHQSYKCSERALYASIGMLTEFLGERWYNGEWSSSGDMAQCLVELWHDTCRVVVVYQHYVTYSSGVMVRWSQS